MKSIVKVGLLCVLAIVSSIIIYDKFGDGTNNSDSVTADEKKFKEEYESLNNSKYSNGNNYLEINIEENNGIVYASYDQIHEILTEGTGVIYFGFPECPWCRNAVPMLLQAASNTGIDKIYYFNAYDIRDVKHLEEDKIITDKEGSKEYYELVDLMSDYLGEYEGLNDKNIKRLYFPTVVFVLDGKIVGIHIGTLDSQEDPFIPLTENQKGELVNIYMKYMNLINSEVCDDKC